MIREKIFNNKYIIFGCAAISSLGYITYKILKYNNYIKNIEIINEENSEENTKLSTEDILKDLINEKKTIENKIINETDKINKAFTDLETNKKKFSGLDKVSTFDELQNESMENVYKKNKSKFDNDIINLNNKLEEINKKISNLENDETII